MANVKVYSTPTCPYCKMLKAFLADNNVAYEDIDVSRNQMAAQEMVTRSGQMGVPVLDIDGEIVVGFDRGKIKKLLGLKDKPKEDLGQAAPPTDIKPQ